MCAVSKSAKNARSGSADYRVRRSDLQRSVEDSRGFSVYDAIADRIDWTADHPWRALLLNLNRAQRAVVSLAQVHEHAAFNGLEESLAFHGPDVVGMAAEGAVALEYPEIAAMLTAALRGDRAWPELEDAWFQTAEFEMAEFIESHAADFFIDE